MGFNVTNDDIEASFSQSVAFLKHFIGFPSTRRVSEIDFEGSAVLLFNQFFETRMSHRELLHRKFLVQCQIECQNMNHRLSQDSPLRALHMILNQCSNLIRINSTSSRYSI